jgi:rRNA maturation endonuclease Nob1
MTETQTPQSPSHGAAAKPGEKSDPKIHRVCIGCNNMFEVTLDNYEAKHCPACHKG